MKVRLGKEFGGGTMAVAKRGKRVPAPEFELADNPTLTFKGLREYRMKRCGRLVVWNEVAA